MIKHSQSKFCVKKRIYICFLKHSIEEVVSIILIISYEINFIADNLKYCIIQIAHMHAKFLSFYACYGRIVFF